MYYKETSNELTTEISGTQDERQNINLRKGKMDTWVDRQKSQRGTQKFGGWEAEGGSVCLLSENKCPGQVSHDVCSSLETLGEDNELGTAIPKPQ